VIACYGHGRDLPPKDGSSTGRRFAMIWEMERPRAPKRVAAIANVKKRQVILATDPDREARPFPGICSTY